MESKQTNEFRGKFAPVLFEEGLDATGLGKYNYALLVLCCFMIQAMALELFGLSFLGPACTCDLKLNIQQMSILSAIPLMGVIVTAHMWGYVADTMGRRTTLLISNGGAFIFSMLASFSPHWLVLALLKFISAAFISATHGIVYTIIGEFTPAKYRNKFVLLTTSALMFSQGIMAALAYIVLPLQFKYEVAGISYLPWRLLAQTYGLPCGISFLILLVCLESPKYLISNGRGEDALEVLRKMYAMNTGNKPEDFPASALVFEEERGSKVQSSFWWAVWNQTVPLLKKPLLKHTLLISFLYIAVYMPQNAYIMWLPTITNSYVNAMGSNSYESKNFCKVLTTRVVTPVRLNSTVSIDETCDSTIQTLSIISVISFSAVCSILNTLITYITIVVKKKYVFMFIMLLSGACSVCLNFIYNMPASIISFFLSQFTALCFGLLGAYTVEIYPTYLRAMAVCLTIMIGRGSGIIGINLLGIMLDKHCEGSFYLFGSLIIAGGLAAFFLPEDVSKSKVIESNR